VRKLLREELRSVSAIIFDKDGVIADSEEINVDSTVAAFTEFGMTLPASARATVVGRHPGDFLPALAAAAGVPHADVPGLMQRKAELYGEMWRDQGRLCQGAETLLATLAELGMPLGICTNATADELAAFLARFGLTEYFSVALSRDHVRRPKPAPDIYRLAADRLAIAPERMLVAEDSPFGIRAAHDAGAICVAIASQPLDPACAAMARHVVRNLDELGAMLVPEPAC
jgi:HAD superfamily hydrolase (TIGR01509 family)